MIRALLVTAMAVVLTCGCSIPWLSDEPLDPDCPPVDVGGECFTATRQGFIDHALASTQAWPQLRGIQVEANEVIEAFDDAAGKPTWIVPIRSGAAVVAASRFLPLRDQVRLAEIVLYQPPRGAFPKPGPNERLVIFTNGCGDAIPPDCLFTNYGWRLEAAP